MMIMVIIILGLRVLYEFHRCNTNFFSLDLFSSSSSSLSSIWIDNDDSKFFEWKQNFQNMLHIRSSKSSSLWMNENENENLTQVSHKVLFMVSSSSGWWWWSMDESIDGKKLVKKKIFCLVVFWRKKKWI